MLEKSNRMRALISSVAGMFLLAGCASVPASSELARFPVLAVPGSLAEVHAACREGLRDFRFPLEEDLDCALRGPWVQDRGFAWRLSVELEERNGVVLISTTLRIEKERDLRALHDLLKGASEAANDDEFMESGNFRAATRDRGGIDAADRKLESEREQRIGELIRRVENFLLSLENRLTLPVRG